MVILAQNPFAFMEHVGHIKTKKTVATEFFDQNGWPGGLSKFFFVFVDYFLGIESVIVEDFVGIHAGVLELAAEIFAVYTKSGL